MFLHLIVVIIINHLFMMPSSLAVIEQRYHKIIENVIPDGDDRYPAYGDLDWQNCIVNCQYARAIFISPGPVQCYCYTYASHLEHTGYGTTLLLDDRMILGCNASEQMINDHIQAIMHRECPSEYVYDRPLGKCIREPDEVMTFGDAKIYCERDGATMMTAKSDKDWKWFADVDLFWIGIHMPQINVFTDTESNPVDVAGFANWCGQEPKHGEFGSIIVNQGCWKNVGDEGSFFFACQTEYV